MLSTSISAFAPHWYHRSIAPENERLNRFAFAGEAD
jgi:hypothetical protein